MYEKDGGNGTDHQRVRAGIELRPQKTAQRTSTKIELEWFERDRICENRFCPFLFTRTMSQSLYLRETLAATTITMRNLLGAFPMVLRLSIPS